MSALQAALDRADALGAAGDYFEAHEELEAFWMKSEGQEKVLLQGLIQIAAGLHRLRSDPRATVGAYYLLDRGVEKLDRAAGLLVPTTLSRLKAVLAPIRASGLAPETLTFGLKAA